MIQSERATLVGSVTILAEQVAASMGMEVVLVEIKGGGRSIVRVYIDQAGGVSVEDCERFSKRFSVLLDVEDRIPFSYVLEVSSPGLDRPLVREADFQRFTGRQAKLRTSQPLQGQRNFRGKIIGTSGGHIRLELSPGQEVEIDLSKVERANLVTEIEVARSGSRRQ